MKRLIHTLFEGSRFTPDASSIPCLMNMHPVRLIILVLAGVLCLQLASVQAQVAGNLDFGDAPSPFPTLLVDDGARHALGNLRLGMAVDGENNGQASADAMKDDVTGDVDDEDGVFLVGGSLFAGTDVTFNVIVRGDGRAFLNGWIDFNQNGSWADAGEQVFVEIVVVPGQRTLTVSVPADLSRGLAFARFRISTQANLSFSGAAEDGEVEDYVLLVGEPVPKMDFDFGDAPATFGTLAIDNGPRHALLKNFFLGNTVDVERDGLPTMTADGDDLVPTTGPDDEDGVSVTSPAIVAGRTVDVQVTLTGQAGKLDAWIDFNGNGKFDAIEKIFNSQAIVNGANALTFSVPEGAKTGTTFARYRLSVEGGLTPVGGAPNGEVEDYKYAIEAPQSAELDFGDAPELYPVTAAQNGAAHVIVEGFHLGAGVDMEADGQPDNMALGDDNNPAGLSDDEDGVVFVKPNLNPGMTFEVDVTASKDGKLDAWIDFNRNGDWSDKDEKIFHAVALTPGTSRLSFFVPGTAKLGGTAARFRFSQDGGVLSTGVVSSGEVEDHLVSIQAPPQDDCTPRTHWGKDFWLTFPGNLSGGETANHTIQLCIVGTPGATGSVAMPGIDPPFLKNFTMPPAGFLEIDLPNDADLHDNNDIVTKQGINVLASELVAVYGLNRIPYTTDGYLGLPSDVIGREYLVQCYPNLQSGVGTLNGTQFAIVGSQDATTLSITPSVEVAGHVAGAAFTITLNRGDTFQLRSDQNAPADLSGSQVISDKPVAVFGSHQCAFVESSNTFFCDYLVEQMLPINRAGELYIRAPLATRSNGDTFHILATKDGTTVTENGATIATLNAGEVHETVIIGAGKIGADLPVFVSQLSNSSDFDGVTDADPFMVNLQHTGQYMSMYDFCVPDFGFPSHYVNVVVPTPDMGSVTLDGAPISVGLFTAAASGYSVASVAVAPGLHKLRANNPIGAFVYGFSEYESYGFPAGLLVGDSTPPVLICPMDSITLVVDTSAAAKDPCRALLGDYRDNVTVTDDCGLPDVVVVRQLPPPGTPLEAGTHRVILAAADAAGNIGYCTLTVIVSDPTAGPLIIKCPQDMTVMCTHDLGAVVHFRVTASQGCVGDIPVICEPLSGGRFPVGTTTVVCTARDMDNQTIQCTFKVTVTCDREVPGITKIPNRELLLIGDRLSIAPNISGSGDLTYQWFHNGEPVDNRNASVLVIDQVGFADSGLYWLSVQNEFGVAFSARTRVQIGSSIVEPDPTGNLAMRIKIEGFPLNVRLLSGRIYTVQVSANLKSWTDLVDISGGDTVAIDAQAKTLSLRFYRVVEK
jgi:hypothetical protein